MTADARLTAAAREDSTVLRAAHPDTNPTANPTRVLMEDAVGCKLCTRAVTAMSPVSRAFRGRVAAS
jgi:hypothetical protein